MNTDPAPDRAGGWEQILIDRAVGDAARLLALTAPAWNRAGADRVVVDAILRRTAHKASALRPLHLTEADRDRVIETARRYRGRVLVVFDGVTDGSPPRPIYTHARIRDAWAGDDSPQITLTAAQWMELVTDIRGGDCPTTIDLGDDGGIEWSDPDETVRLAFDRTSWAVFEGRLVRGAYEIPTENT